MMAQGKASPKFVRTVVASWLMAEMSMEMLMARAIRGECESRKGRLLSPSLLMGTRFAPLCAHKLLAARLG